MALSEVGDPTVVRMGVAGQNPEGYVFKGLLLNTPRAADPDAVAVKHEFEHHERMVRGVSAFQMEVFGKYFSNIEGVYNIADEKRKVLLGQPRAHIRRH
jgi:hypothetical protein